MRRFALIALLAMAASACTLDINIDVSLTETGAGRVTVDIVADEEFHQLHELTGRDFEDLVAARGEEVGLAFEVTPGATTRYSAASRVVVSETLEGILEDLVPGIGNITIDRTGSELVFDGLLNPLTSVDDVEPYFDDADPSQFADDVTVTLTMAIPGELSTTTGTRIGPGELSWAIPFADSDTRVLARSTLEPEGSSIPWTAIIIVVTLATAFGFLIAIRSRLTGDQEATTTPQPMRQTKSIAPEDQPVSVDQTPPEDQAVEPPWDPDSTV
ncbi:MAG: hypothetical protein OER12_08790 [Acidimicrobiia bacterium]|nr:hypothetical protein [Acidimicrobiia bacterium]